MATNCIIYLIEEAKNNFKFEKALFLKEKHQIFTILLAHTLYCKRVIYPAFMAKYMKLRPRATKYYC